MHYAGEYIEDTEEYINIELDSSRNKLIRLEIVLTAGTFSLALWNLVGGDFRPIISRENNLCTFNLGVPAHTAGDPSKLRSFASSINVALLIQ